MKIVKRLTFWLVMLLSVELVGQDVFTLQSALEYAKNNSITYKSNQINVEKAKQRIKNTLSAGLPQIAGSLRFQNYLELPTSLVPANAFDPNASADEFAELQFGTDYNINANLQVDQLIFDGSYIVGVKASRYYKNFVEADNQKNEIDLENEVKEAFYTVLVAKENTLLLKDLLANTEDILDETTAIYKEGLAEEQDVDQLTLSVLSLKSSITQAEGQIELSKDLLKFKMGYDIEKDIKVSGELDSLSQDALKSVSSTYDTKKNINYQVLEHQYHLQSLNVQLAKAKYLPTLGAFFQQSYQYQANDLQIFDRTWFPTTVWGVQLSIPIWSSGQRGSSVATAKLDLQESGNQLDNLSESLKLQVAQAKIGLETSQKQYEVEKENKVLADKILKNTQIKYKEGVATSLELSQTQNQATQAQTNYINAAFNLINAKLALDKLLINQ